MNDELQPENNIIDEIETERLEADGPEPNSATPPHGDPLKRVVPGGEAQGNSAGPRGRGAPQDTDRMGSSGSDGGRATTGQAEPLESAMASGQNNDDDDPLSIEDRYGSGGRPDPQALENAGEVLGATTEEIQDARST